MLFNKIKKQLNISQNKKNIAKISFGTLIGQGISLVTLPIIARVYGAEIIGSLTLLQSIAVIINSFSDLGLTNGIMLEEDEHLIIQLYKVITTLIIGFSILTSLGLFFYYSIVEITPSNLNIFFIAIFVFIATLTLQQVQVCYTWLNRKKKYEVLMKNPMINNLAFGIISIILGLCGLKLYGYFIGWILGQIITLIHMRRSLPKGMITLNIKDYKEVFIKYNRFLKYQLPTNIFSNIKNQIPILAIKAFFGSQILGYYSVTVKIMQIPISLLASAMGRVFFQTIADMKRKSQEIGEFVYNNITKVTRVAIIPLILMLAVGDYAITIFLGSDWKIAGDFMRILVFQNFFMFLMSTVQGIAIILDKQRLAMSFCIFQSIGFLVGLSIGKYVFHSFYIGIVLMSIVFIICNIIYFCILFKSMKISSKRYLANISIHITFMILVSITLRYIVDIVFYKIII